MKSLSLLTCLFLSGCATWNSLPLAGKIGAVAGGAAAAQSVTGTALNVKNLLDDEKK